MYDLQPIYDGAKSFYKKAVIIRKKYGLILMSYDTNIFYFRERDNGKKELYFYRQDIDNPFIYSRTTLRHVKEFLKQYYYCDNRVITKQDIRRLIEESFK